MRYKSLLLGTVSLGTLGATANVTPAIGDEPLLQPAFQYYIEGALLFGHNTVAEDKLGSGGPGGSGYSGQYVAPNLGYRGAIMLGSRINENWDARGVIAVNQQLDAVSSAYYSGFSSGWYETLLTNFSFQTLDFEAGYSPVVGENVNLRLFGGLRGLHYTDVQDKMGSWYSFGGSGYYFSNLQSEFIGVGPRLGVEGSARMGDGPLGVSAMVAGAVLRGIERQTRDAQEGSNSGSSSPHFQDIEEEWKTIYDVEASLGVDLYLNDLTKFTVGYRAEQISGVQGGFSGGGPTTRLTQGVFARLSGEM